MDLIKNNDQKKYLTKFLQDMSKATLVLTVIVPFVRVESANVLVYTVGGLSALAIFIAGYLLESRRFENG